MAEVANPEQTWREMDEKLRQILSWLSEKISEQPDKRGILAKAFNKYISTPGSSACFQEVQAKFAAEIEQKLQDMDIPYLMFPVNGTDNYAFVVGEPDRDRFVDIQMDVLSMSTEYARECTAMHVMNLAAKSMDSQVVKVSIDNPDMLAIAKQKAFESKLIAGVLDSFDKDGGGELYLRKQDMFKANGHDLAEFEMRMALIQSYNYNGSEQALNDRLAVANYDANLSKDMVANILKGEDCVIGTPTKEGALPTQPYIEFKNGVLEVNGTEVEGLEALKREPAKLEMFITKSIKDSGILDGVMVERVKDLKDALANPEVKKRPRQNNPTHKLANDCIDQAIEIISKRASEIAVTESKGLKDMSKPIEQVRYEKKKAAFVEFRKDAVRAAGTFNCPELAVLLNSEKNTIIDPGNENKKIINPKILEILQCMESHFTNTNENSEYEVAVDVDFDVNKKNRNDIASKQSKMNQTYNDRYGIETPTEEKDNNKENDKDMDV